MEDGSYTMEATLVLPLVLFCTVAVVLFGLYLYDKAILYRDAAITADRAAFVWDNSHKDPVTGAFPIGEDDGLYWRFTGDGIAGWFGFGGNGGSVTVPLPAEQPGTRTDGPRGKLLKAARMLPQQAGGSLAYSNRLLERTVAVRLERTFVWNSFVRAWFGTRHAAAEADAVVIDPVETIRTIDLVRTYAPRLNAIMTPEQAGQALPAPQQEEPEPTIRSEAEASAYIRQLVGGREVHFDTDVGQWRKVDALDRDGVAHEAKYTVNQADARQQIAKDVELMRSGRVKGVVWHFFRHAVNGSTGLTDKLRRDLERSGIVVIVHN